ncbi:hypothetical protein [Rhodopirellula baltica]|uniref:Uncharacterized protein n=1 Tax=Rhodopirellula baltica WH47 TaxID=991778 RepID=F2AQY7_RHOBT|nr:hypothetical protein [Rhodopirellula baltica]EGF27921.1 conserved hypothetical protein, membrane [Rhodopirellula baltica WH47]
MLKKSNNAFALGRSWWVVPVVVMTAQLLLYFVLEATTGFDGDSAADWWLFISLFVMLPTMAAILLSPGSRWPHWCVASICICWGVVIFGFQSGFEIGMVIPAMVVCAIQAANFRWSATPPWRIRPSKSRKPSVSIRWLLVFTAIVAALITLIRVSGLNRELVSIASYTTPAGVPALIANYLVMMKSRWKRLGMLFGVFLAGAFLHSQSQAGWTLADDVWRQLVGQHHSNRFASQILFVAPSASLVTVTLMQLALKRFSNGRQRKWPSKQPANATLSG